MATAEFNNRIVRQGNSLCVRIPHSAIRQLSLQEGSETAVTITPQHSMGICNEDVMQHLLNAASKVKQLDKFRIPKQRLFIFLNFEFLKTTSSPNLKREKELQIKFVKTLRKEIGVKLANEFLEWGMTFNREAFTKENGAYWLKQEYKQ